jgi:hypothetical protein
VLATAHEAFVLGMQVTSAIAAGIGLAVAVLVLAVLHNHQPTAIDQDPEAANTSAAHDGPGDTPDR